MIMIVITSSSYFSIIIVSVGAGIPKNAGEIQASEA
jgi:hypothetical protein